MREIKPLIIVKARHSIISGGYYRTYEILRNGKAEGINYLIATDALSYQNYAKMFQDFKEIIKKYKVYFIDNFAKTNNCKSSLLRSIKLFQNLLSRASSIYEIARKENPDIIIGPSENLAKTTYLSGKLCRKPWTINFTGTNELLQPEIGLVPVTLLNIFKHIKKKSIKDIPFKFKIGYALDLMSLLKVAEGSLILTVSPSVKVEITQLNPKIEFHVVTPGNGVDLEKIPKNEVYDAKYDGIFFSRIISEKGIFDLLKIWKYVVKKFPRAKLAIVGPSEDPMILNRVCKIIHSYGIANNVAYLGAQSRASLIDLIMSSKLMIYPTRLDSFSLAILESLACGRPVVTYNILATKYNFFKCKGVLRCPVGNIKTMADEIMLLLGNEDLRMRLSKEAREFAKDFDWKNVVRAEKEAYFKVIEWFCSH
jgi:glycosyltransferase involved in cell wall biosynthesis